MNTAFSVEDKDFIPSESEADDELDCGNKALKQWSKKSSLILRALGKITLFYEYYFFLFLLFLVEKGKLPIHSSSDSFCARDKQ